MAYGEFVKTIRKRWIKEVLPKLGKEGNPRDLFADTVGITVTTLSRWENGKGLRLGNLERLLKKTFGVKIEQCLFLPDSVVDREELDARIAAAVDEKLQVFKREILTQIHGPPAKPKAK